MAILAIIGSKGGIGKSTICTNLLVAARLAGLNTAGLDLDEQDSLDEPGSLLAWAQLRGAAGHAPAVPVAGGNIVGWRQALAEVRDASLVIADAPPGFEGEDRRAGLRGLARASDLVLVPSLPEGPTLRRLETFVAALGAIGSPVVFVLNRVKPRSRDATGARARLVRLAEPCPVEIPDRADVHRAMDAGLAAVEVPGAGGGEEMRALWAFVAKRTGVG